MSLSEKLSGTLFSLAALPFLKAFKAKSPEAVLQKSLLLLDDRALSDIKEFLVKHTDSTGAFTDRGSRPDLYYTLFGYFIARALKINELLTGVRSYTEEQIKRKDYEGVHLYCAAILQAGLFEKKYNAPEIVKRVKIQARENYNDQLVYSIFLNLLACYYLDDFESIYRLRRKFDKADLRSDLPASVTAASLVLKKSFGEKTAETEDRLMKFYDGHGGFRATAKTPFADLLSTAVSLYALKYAGYDITLIRPDCMTYVDSLFYEGGFGATSDDTETDVEYTFYGLLALGSLA
jgi:hypothetical protein